MVVVFLIIVGLLGIYYNASNVYILAILLNTISGIIIIFNMSKYELENYLSPLLFLKTCSIIWVMSIIPFYYGLFSIKDTTLGFCVSYLLLNPFWVAYVRYKQLSKYNKSVIENIINSFKFTKSTKSFNSHSSLKSGRIKLYREDKGWGYIEEYKGGIDVFFHISCVEPKSCIPIASQQVKFKDKESTKKPGKREATKVVLRR